MDVGKAFTFVTDDEGWVRKIGIWVIVFFFSFLLIPVPLAVGYMVVLARNVMEGHERPLPEWDDWGELFRDGLNLIVAQFVYTLPFWLLTGVAVLATFGLSAVGEANADAAGAGFLATFGLIGCVSFLLVVALFFIGPALAVQYIRTDELSACVRVSEIIAIVRDHLGDVVVAAVAPLIVGFLVSIVMGVLAIIPCIGWLAAILLGFVVGPYVSAVTGHLYGQLAARVEGKGKAALA